VQFVPNFPLVRII